MTKLSMSEEEMLKRKYTRPYEKRIAELEQKLEQTEKDLADYQFNYPTIKELQKENAELKKVLNCNNCSELSEEECEVCAEYSHFKCRRKDQLTKAKDHIKKLLDCLKQDTNDPQTNYYVCQYMDKAEQFLNEVEK